MIKFDLICENQHIFEASFDDSKSFEKQKRKKQIECIMVEIRCNLAYVLTHWEKLAGLSSSFQS